MTKSTRIGANFTPVVSESVAAEYFTDNEFSVVGFDTRTGGIHRMNPSASAIWSLIDGKSTVADIAAELAEILGLRSSTASKNVRTSIAEFQSLALIEGGAVAAALDGQASTEQRPVLPRVADP